MHPKTHILFALLACLPLAACSHPTPPPATQAGDTADKGLIARHVDRALDEARKELHANNLSLNGHISIHVNDNGKHAEAPESHLPKAEISPQGDLLVEGKPVAVTAAQRQQLLGYRNQVIAIAEAGMDIGAQGAGIAGTALQGVAGAIFGGDKGQKDFEAKMEAEGKKIEAQAMQLCKRLPPLLASQQSLAASLPAFKPYATMTREDIDDCGKHGKGDGVAVMSD
ncbi:hypothetical protein [Thermomonas sp.]|uniref:hypothetical protein n=1 Tax=Thermomonas sp. TaxID=1971895 RepID=UPI0035B18AE9